MLVTTLRNEQAAIVRDIRVVVINISGNRVTLGFEFAGELKAIDVVEIAPGTTEHDLCLTRHRKSA